MVRTPHPYKAILRPMVMGDIMQVCPRCATLHDKAGKYCSRSCANSRPQTHETRQKIALGLKGNVPHNKGKDFRIIRKCATCDTEFLCNQSSPKRFCCKDCSPNLGGYREGSGHAKTGYYKGIYCGSTYELVWVIYQIDHGNEFIRFPHMLESCGVKYLPDFLQNGMIVEIKGYERLEAVERKTKVAANHGYDVVVLRKPQLEREFEWVKANYTYTKVYELYDDYTPTHTYVCDGCSVTFTTDTKRPSHTKFCSRTCAGSYRRARF